MSFVSRIIGTAERVPLPDVIIRAAIQRLCSRTATRLASGDAESDASFADEMEARAIADHASRVSPHDAGDCGLVQGYACGVPATMCGFRGAQTNGPASN